jgi:bacterioferritin-associated ferredoxin
MYVCICNSVTEKDIKRAVRDGACSMSCLQEELAVATCCGQCHSAAKSYLEESLDSGFNFPLLGQISTRS